VRRFFRDNLVILVLLNVANIFNYLFQIIVARNLNPEDYGSFNALNSLAVVLLTPVDVLAYVYSKFTVQLSLDRYEAIKTLAVKGLKGIMVVACVAILAATVYHPWVKRYLHLESSIPIVIMMTLVILSFQLPLLLGLIQGLRRFTTLGWGLSLNIYVRFFACVLFVPILGMGVNGALIAGVLGVLGATLYILWVLRDVLRMPGAELPEGIFGTMWKYALPVFFTTGMVIMLGNLDVVLVRHYCSPTEAGYYATGAILGRVAFYLPGVLISVLFPETARAKQSGQDSRKFLWVSFLMTAFLGGGVALVCNIWGEWIIQVLYGAKYMGAGDLLGVISAAMALLALANVMFTYLLARSEFKYLWFLVSGVVLMLSAIALFHDTAMMVAKTVLISMFLILSGTLATYLIPGKRLVVST